MGFLYIACDNFLSLSCCEEVGEEKDCFRSRSYSLHFQRFLHFWTRVDVLSQEMYDLLGALCPFLFSY